jgi:hypothetical protein
MVMRLISLLRASATTPAARAESRRSRPMIVKPYPARKAAPLARLLASKHSGVAAWPHRSACGKVGGL